MRTIIIRNDDHRARVARVIADAVRDGRRVLTDSWQVGTAQRMQPVIAVEGADLLVSHVDRHIGWCGVQRVKADALMTITAPAPILAAVQRVATVVAA